MFGYQYHTFKKENCLCKLWWWNWTTQTVNLIGQIRSCLYYYCYWRPSSSLPHLEHARRDTGPFCAVWFDFGGCFLYLAFPNSNWDSEVLTTATGHCTMATSLFIHWYSGIFCHIVIRDISLFVFPVQQWHQYDLPHHSTQGPDRTSQQNAGRWIWHSIQHQKSCQQTVRTRGHHLGTTTAKTL